MKLVAFSEQTTDGKGIKSSNAYDTATRVYRWRNLETNCASGLTDEMKPQHFSVYSLADT